MNQENSLSFVYKKDLDFVFDNSFIDLERNNDLALHEPFSSESFNLESKEITNNINEINCFSELEKRIEKLKKMKMNTEKLYKKYSDQKLKIIYLQDLISELKNENNAAHKETSEPSNSTEENSNSMMNKKAKSSRMTWEEKEINDLVSLSEQFKKKNKTDWSKIIKNHADKFKAEHLNSKILAGQLSILKKQRNPIVK
ncbi:unnamed protein product [Brachionus calyciflorus]|uniref:Myb-like domain-containing protein n=1 Tax=Brachionus calyciflorus TaxID=104777 RepID=A0A813YET7_9BILA|nr:unnamed protein product [Brachionus calyciflorus]